MLERRGFLAGMPMATALAAQAQAPVGGRTTDRQEWVDLLERIEGKTTVANAGSVGYVAPNEEHGWKNVGSGQARYFVMALGRERA